MSRINVRFITRVALSLIFHPGNQRGRPCPPTFVRLFGVEFAHMVTAGPHGQGQFRHSVQSGPLVRRKKAPLFRGPLAQREMADIVQGVSISQHVQVLIAESDKRLRRTIEFHLLIFPVPQKSEIRIALVISDNH